MNDFARHFKIFNAQPTDDLVEKRTRTISELTTAFKRKSDLAAALQLASDLLEGLQNGKLPAPLREQVAKAITKSSASFVADDHELEVVACAAMAVLQHVRTTKASGPTPTVHDLFAAALQSGLEFQAVQLEPRLEALRQEIRDAAEEALARRTEEGRKRSKVPDVAVPAESTTGSAVSSAVNQAIGALRTNALLDREELDLLWWVLADWSRVLRVHFSRRPDLAGLVTCALEAAGKLLHLPAEAHFQLVLRHVSPGNQANLTELLAAMSDDLEAIRQQFAETDAWVSTHSRLFPLLGAIAAGNDGSSADAQARRTHEEWIRRALLESSLVRHAVALRG